MLYQGQGQGQGQAGYNLKPLDAAFHVFLEMPQVSDR